MFKSTHHPTNKKPHKCGATFICLKNLHFLSVFGPRLHQMQLPNLCLVLYYFEIHLLLYLSLTQHTIQLYFVLYFSHLNLPITSQTKNLTNVRLKNLFQENNNQDKKVRYTSHPINATKITEKQ